MKKIRIGTSRIHGRGILADEYIKKGERIQYIQGKKTWKITRNARDSKLIANWIGLDRYWWIRTIGSFRFINHSCDPNTAITGTKTLVAIRNIKRNEELTIDYSLTDADPHWLVKCHCGSKQCRKNIRAIYALPESVFKKRLPFIPKAFQRLYFRIHPQLRQ